MRRSDSLNLSNASQRRQIESFRAAPSAAETQGLELAVEKTAGNALPRERVSQQMLCHIDKVVR